MGRWEEYRGTAGRWQPRLPLTTFKRKRAGGFDLAALWEFSSVERLGRPNVEQRQFGNIGAKQMGSTADKASGLANEAVGKAKQGIGNVVGSDKLKAEGAAQELKGDAQKATGDAKAAVKDATNKTADAINKKL
jgi:uncharacterized protein YjbJ (UPF0337 family)